MEHIFEALLIGAFFMLTVIVNTVSLIHSAAQRPIYKFIHWLSWLFSIIVIFIGLLGRDEYTSFGFGSLLREPNYLSLLMVFVIICFLWRTYLIIKQINTEDTK